MQNLFILTKYDIFSLSYECFFIFCNAFLLKSAISSHKNCANYYKYDQDRINVTTQKKLSLEQSSSLHNQIRDIINPKYLKKEREKNLKLPQERLKDETRSI